jgi:biotin transport system substrate-specific component
MALIDIAARNGTLAAALWPRSGKLGEMSDLARNALLAVAGSLLLWACAKIQVPFYPVPVSMGTFAVLAIGMAYGPRLGAVTLLLYLAEGAAGLPVFANTPERGIGLAYMVGPTGGYLVGYLVAVLIVGWFAERGADKSAIRLFGVMFVADVAILGLGFAWLASLFGAESAWSTGVVPFLLGDLLKVAIAALAVSGSRLAAPRQE